MANKKEETKRKIIEVTSALLDETENSEEITIRKIAEEAGVGIGLINYHFKSRDNLLNEVATIKMQELAGTMEKMDKYVDNPLKYLKDMLIHMSDIAMKDSKLNKISVEFDLLNGNFRTCLYLLPILREIFGSERSEMELRLIAFQIIIATQTIYLKQDDFHMFTGIDIEIKAERDRLINSIVDNLIK